MPVHHSPPVSDDLPDELLAAIQEAYAPAGLRVTTPVVREPESGAYGACRLALNGRSVVFRIAKTTPTKVGQFVTLWKRPTLAATIAPLDRDDGVAFVVVSVRQGTHRGQFVFPQQTLIERGIFSCAQRGGKRALRVYPPWCEPLVPTAVRTQQWQLPYFLLLPLDERTGVARVCGLFTS